MSLDFSRSAARVLSLSLGLAAFEAQAQAQEQAATVSGASAPVDERSLKCDVKMQAGFNFDRLANCDSARLVRMGDKDGFAVRFRIDPDVAKISGGSRAEVRDMYEAVNGEEVWYRFSTQVPEDFPIAQAHRVVIAQWHERLPEGAVSLRPPLAHRLINGDFVVTLWNKKLHDASGGLGDGEILYIEKKMPLGLTRDYIYRVVWAPDGAGRVTGWMREAACPAGAPRSCDSSWRQFIDHREAIGYPQAIGYYFKLGVYTVHAFTKPMTVFHSGYRRGANAADVGAPREVAGR